MTVIPPCRTSTEGKAEGTAKRLSFPENSLPHPCMGKAAALSKCDAGCDDAVARLCQRLTIASEGISEPLNDHRYAFRAVHGHYRLLARHNARAIYGALSNLWMRGICPRSCFRTPPPGMCSWAECAYLETRLLCPR
jgi:hypothetical protein